MVLDTAIREAVRFGAEDLFSQAFVLQSVFSSLPVDAGSDFSTPELNIQQLHDAAKLFDRYQTQQECPAFVETSKVELCHGFEICRYQLPVNP